MKMIGSILLATFLFTGVAMGVAVLYALANDHQTWEQ